MSRKQQDGDNRLDRFDKWEADPDDKLEKNENPPVAQRPRQQSMPNTREIAQYSRSHVEKKGVFGAILDFFEPPKPSRQDTNSAKIKISTPFNAVHVAHVGFDARTVWFA